MKRFDLNKRAILILAVLGIGIFGAIFFFPVNFNNQYTCLYHWLFSPEHAHFYAADDIVSHYIRPFGYLWWGSLLLIGFSIYGLKRFAMIQTNQPKADQPSFINKVEV